MFDFRVPRIHWVGWRLPVHRLFWVLVGVKALQELNFVHHQRAKKLFGDVATDLYQKPCLDVHTLANLRRFLQMYLLNPENVLAFLSQQRRQEA